MTKPTLIYLTAVLLTSSVACRQAEEAPAAAERVENAELGLAIAALPEFFRVDVNQGSTLELVPADPEVGGRLHFEVGEQELAGVNLVAAVEAHREEILARPGGEYKGQRELGSPLGTTFYSRGHYADDDGTVEETVILAIHPWGDRLLRMVYRYPAADDTATRLQDQLFEVLGELEGLPVPADADAESS